MDSLNERREFERRDCLLQCLCQGEYFRCSGQIVNLSFGGAGIAGTDNLPTEGAKLQVEILLPWKTIELRSRVMWVNPGAEKKETADFGVEFLDTLSERQQKLADFLPQSNAIED
ncbi:MAG: PilZ domain-containing protein [bacterium]